MTLDINNNGSYFYNGNNKKKKDEEDSDSEKKKKDEKEKSEKHSYEHKSADASSLEVLGMQNALMIHQESIVHNPHNHHASHSPSGAAIDNNPDISHIKHEGEPLKTNVPQGVSQKVNISKTSDNIKSDTANNDEKTVLSDVEDYNNLGIVRNEDGTFSVRNNPFGKFTKATIEDYISRYILPSLADSWINGYSKLYTVNDKKVLLMKVTSKDGKKAFKGRILENGEKYIIFYGVNDRGLPDGNKVLKKLKINPPKQQEQ